MSDPMLDGITRYGSLWPNNTVMLALPDERVRPDGDEYVLLSDLPALIAAVRDDEREAAAQRVAKLPSQGVQRESGLVPFIDRESAVAAAGGKDTQPYMPTRAEEERRTAIERGKRA